MPKLTDEEKKMRKDFRETCKQLDHERGKDRIKLTRFIEHEPCSRSFVIFDGTQVSEGGWLIGRKWMTAKHMNKMVSKWVANAYATRADKWIEHNPKLAKIDKQYDLSAGCGQCGGCRWFAALDGDYGICFSEKSPNEGKVVFEHAGCIQHSFIQELLNKEVKG